MLNYKKFQYASILFFFGVAGELRADATYNTLSFFYGYHATHCQGRGGTWGGMACDGNSSPRKFWYREREKQRDQARAEARKRARMEGGEALFVAVDAMLTEEGFQALDLGRFDPELDLPRPESAEQALQYQCLRGSLLALALQEYDFEALRGALRPFSSTGISDGAAATYVDNVVDWTTFLLRSHFGAPGQELFDVSRAEHAEVFQNFIRRETAATFLTMQDVVVNVSTPPGSDGYLYQVVVDTGLSLGRHDDPTPMAGIICDFDRSDLFGETVWVSGSSRELIDRWYAEGKNRQFRLSHFTNF